MVFINSASSHRNSFSPIKPSQRSPSRLRSSAAGHRSLCCEFLTTCKLLRPRKILARSPPLARFLHVGVVGVLLYFVLLSASAWHQLGYDGRLLATGKDCLIEFFDLRKAGKPLGTYTECHTDAVTQVFSRCISGCPADCQRSLSHSRYHRRLIFRHELRHAL